MGYGPTQERYNRYCQRCVVRLGSAPGAGLRRVTSGDPLPQRLCLPAIAVSRTSHWTGSVIASGTEMSTREFEGARSTETAETAGGAQGRVSRRFLTLWCPALDPGGSGTGRATGVGVCLHGCSFASDARGRPAPGRSSRDRISPPTSTGPGARTRHEGAPDAASLGGVSPAPGSISRFE